MIGLPRHTGAIVLFGGAALVPLVIRDAFFLDSLVLILLWGALSAAWNVAGGYAGQVSIGHASFFGIGAYAGALMVTRFSKSPWLGMILGVVVSIGAGLVIGFLSNRLKGPYFALSTIALSQVLLIAVSRWRGFTAGGEGIPVPYRPGFATLGLGHVAWVYMALASVEGSSWDHEAACPASGKRAWSTSFQTLGCWWYRPDGRRCHQVCGSVIHLKGAYSSAPAPAPAASCASSALAWVT